MKIAVVASEAAPFVKTGGLGDVMQALPLALSQQKNTYVSLFIPYYSQIKYSGKWQTEFLGAFDVPLAWRREYVGIFHLKTRRKKLQIYFIDNEHYFNRGGVYGFADDGERYAYFSKAVLAAMNYLELQPDVVSCHDWQAALIPLLLKTEYRGIIVVAKSGLYGLYALLKHGSRLEQFAEKPAPSHTFSCVILRSERLVYPIQTIPVGIEMNLFIGFQVQESPCKILLAHIKHPAIFRIIRIFTILQGPVIGRRRQIIFQSERISIFYSERQTTVSAICV